MRRRPEIVEDFEREVLGRVPANAPKINWVVKSTVNGQAGVFPVITKQLVGHAENSLCPAISVDIDMTLVTPANAKGPVPVMMMFGSAAFSLHRRKKGENKRTHKKGGAGIPILSRKIP